MSPYSSLPDSAFWNRSVADKEWTDSLSDEPPYLEKNDFVMSMGSCFAANLVPFLESANVQYVRTEKHPPFLQSSDNRFNYDVFSAAYGNLYTARAMRQLIERVNYRFVRTIEPWKSAQGFVDPLRPGLPHLAETLGEYESLTESHLNCTKRALQQSSVLVLTLGLIEAWCIRDNGAALPACPGSIAGEFSDSQHELVVFRFEEIVEDLIKLRAEVLEIRPGMRFLVTVSPVPLVATATSENVVLANSLSKSVLRAAAARFVEMYPDCRYVPSFEILIGAQVRQSFFKSDCRSIAPEGVGRVMEHFLRGLDLDVPQRSLPRMTIAERECEEVLQAGLEQGICD